MIINKKTSYIMMTVLIFIWGFDFVAAKLALDVINPFTLVFFKYLFALAVLMIIKRVREKNIKIGKEDIPDLLVCSLIGMIAYYGFEYNAMSYISVSVLCIILAAMPVASIITEAVFQGKGITAGMVAGTMISLIGVAIIIGADFKELLGGKLLGYILAFGAMISWNIYNFSTEKLHKKYSGIVLSYYQMLITVAVLCPYALLHLPDPKTIGTDIVLWVLFQGVVSAGLGYLIYINALNMIGITPTALFINFLPVVTVFSDWLVLGGKITAMQVAGGVLVIIAACWVIYEEDRIGKQAIAAIEQDES